VITDQVNGEKTMTA